MKDRDEAAAWALNDADACRMLLFKWQSIEANGGRQAAAAMAEWLSGVIRAARQAGAEEMRERAALMTSEYKTAMEIRRAIRALPLDSGVIGKEGE